MDMDSGAYASPDVARPLSKGYARYTNLSLQGSWEHKTGPSGGQGPHLFRAVRHARAGSLYDVLPGRPGGSLPPTHHM